MYIPGGRDEKTKTVDRLRPGERLKKIGVRAAKYGHAWVPALSAVQL